MGKLVLLMHVSLDGFVAGPNGEMNWIHVSDEIFNIASERTNEADTALYGRVTYQMMDAYWPNAATKPKATRHDIEHSAWYNHVKKVVVSKTMAGASISNTVIVSKNLADEISKLKQAAGKNILLLGSPAVVHALTPDNLIDDFWLLVNPVVLGEGIPLFKDVQHRIKLQLVSAKVLDAGVVCLHYTTAVANGVKQ